MWGEKYGEFSRLYRLYSSKRPAFFFFMLTFFRTQHFGERQKAGAHAVDCAVFAISFLNFYHVYVFFVVSAQKIEWKYKQKAEKP